ncbi:hypothetical protein A2U01_0079576, partial [Trifolium medium]|nr:hypothetical protein [Trifolium medium]
MVNKNVMIIRAWRSGKQF